MKQDLPSHIAIIMDGNGRWAKKRFMPKIMGHRAGATALDKLMKKADEYGFKHLTVYAFSTENWKRSKQEVNDLMNLIREFIKEFLTGSKKNNIRFEMIGDLTMLSFDIQEDIKKLVESTKNNTGLCLHIALNYGGRDEIIRAFKNVCSDVKNENINIEDINEEMFSNYLDTKDYPNPELIIRTSGELRLSNFLIWQSAYSEFYFSNKLWPDFTFDDLLSAVNDYKSRDRRFGGRNEVQ